MGGDFSDIRAKESSERASELGEGGVLPSRDESYKSPQGKSLRAEGFTTDEIREVEKVVPDLNVLVYRPQVGRSIANAAEAAIELRDLSGKPVVFKFNGTVLIAHKDDSPASLTEKYLAPFVARQAEHWTPERLAAHNAERLARAEALEKTFMTLPEFLRTWVIGNGTRNYGRELDIEIARDAKLIADTLKTVEAIQEWYQRSSDEQSRIVPFLSEGHSGFSFSQMTRLAVAYLEHIGSHGRIPNVD